MSDIYGSKHDPETIGTTDTSADTEIPADQTAADAFGVLAGELPSGEDTALYTATDDGGCDVLDFRIYTDPGYDPREAETSYRVARHGRATPESDGRKIREKISDKASGEPSTPSSVDTDADESSGAGTETSTMSGSGAGGWAGSEGVTQTKVMGIDIAQGDTEDGSLKSLSDATFQKDILALIAIGLGGITLGLLSGYVSIGMGAYVLASGVVMTARSIKSDHEEDRIFLLLGIVLIVFSFDFFGLVNIL